MVQLTVSRTTKPPRDVTVHQDLVYTNISEIKKMAEDEKESTYLGKWDTIIPNPKSKKSPRLCFFVTCLVFLMVAAIVLVLVIKLSLQVRDEPCCGTVKTPPPKAKNFGQINVKKKENLERDIPWQMKRAFIELRQIMGEFKPKALHPVYRKDLPSYIAYYEAKIKHATGESYAVVSAGERTGDYSLVETGSLPSPLDKLRDKAFLNGHYCSKFFRLSPDGITVCEDDRLDRIVASTGNIDPMNPVTDWEQLDKEVTQALPRLKKEWERLRKVANNVKEWKIKRKFSSENNPNSDQVERVTERGVHCGEFVEIPVQDVSQVRIKFAGVSRTQTKAKDANISHHKWQTKLCKVLNNICDTQNPTKVRQDTTTDFFAGSKYLKFSVNADEKFVKFELEEREIRFQVEFRAARGQEIVMHYGIVLEEKRLGRSVETINYEIPNEKSFPKIHYEDKCWNTGSMLSAWVMVFTYYNKLARTRPELGYRQLGFKKNKLGRHFSGVKERQRYIGKVLARKLGTECQPLKQKATHWDKTRLERWFNRYQRGTSRIMFTGGIHKRSQATRKAINLLKKGIPVLISTQHEYTMSPSYGVATRMRQRQSLYRHCNSIKCSLWKDVALTEFFVRDGSNQGRWQIACTYYAAAALTK